MVHYQRRVVVLGKMHTACVRGEVTRDLPILVQGSCLGSDLIRFAGSSASSEQALSVQAGIVLDRWP